MDKEYFFIYIFNYYDYYKFNSKFVSKKKKTTKIYIFVLNSLSLHLLLSHLNPNEPLLPCPCRRSCSPMTFPSDEETLEQPSS